MLPFIRRAGPTQVLTKAVSKPSSASQPIIAEHNLIASIAFHKQVHIFFAGKESDLDM